MANSEASALVREYFEVKKRIPVPQSFEDPVVTMDGLAALVGMQVPFSGYITAQEQKARLNSLMNRMQENFNNSPRLFPLSYILYGENKAGNTEFRTIYLADIGEELLSLEKIIPENNLYLVTGPTVLPIFQPDVVGKSLVILPPGVNLRLNRYGGGDARFITPTSKITPLTELPYIRRSG